MKIRSSRFLSIFLFGFFLNSCGWIVETTFPVSLDEFLGKQFYEAAVLGQDGMKVLHNERLRSYIQGIADRILKAKEIQYKTEFPYKVTILDDDSVINAVCAPGGYIFVYTGLLHFVKDEATLAGVLAHEIAHAEKRHSMKQLSSSIATYFAIYLVLSYVLGPDLAQHASGMASLSSNLLSLANSRSAEEEADALGFQYMRATPYYPGASANFFRDIKAWRQKHLGEEEDTLPLGKYLSTHPLDDERIADSEKRLKEAGIGSPQPESFFRDRYREKISALLGKRENEEEEMPKAKPSTGKKR
ncbi:peptidase, M48 family [Leptospira inadai serovar Lyme str. 10]|uniref:Peptidase, M48 family n=2 Tax=Leptospira inadai serovar Lyme TaxID=293084 RepID=V6HDH2_9LEPT|nr:M48 family metalloprotease [Leptospira inadai]EQA37148.1 peptidase, M48 family [Leptospira inadai serovar Lyme str. 10]PNV76534.1 peptidase M48 [Leptospira inadai serovar Lyme]